MSRALALDDIADLRAYERERDEFRRHVIDLKKRRRIGVGPFITLVFENRDTIRFQIQEMARAEKILTDEGIQTELDVYNPLIPEPGSLRATLFIELTNEADLREWLPQLVGIEQAVELRLGADGSVVVPATPDPAHAQQLTRETITASVHYVGFELTEAQIDAAAGGITVATNHPNYAHATSVPDAGVEELLGDLRVG